MFIELGTSIRPSHVNYAASVGVELVTMLLDSPSLFRDEYVPNGRNNTNNILPMIDQSASLLSAICHRKTDIVKELLKRGANVYEQKEYERVVVPLRYACGLINVENKKEMQEIIQMLVNAGGAHDMGKLIVEVLTSKKVVLVSAFIHLGLLRKVLITYHVNSNYY